MSIVKETLKFPTSFRRFWEIRRIKKRHPDLKILEKGFTEIGYKCAGYYWITIQYEA